LSITGSIAIENIFLQMSALLQFNKQK